MRRPRRACSAAPLALIAILAVLLGAAPPAAPVARAQSDEPAFQLMPPRDAVRPAESSGRREMIGTAEGEPPAPEAAAASVAAGLPAIALPRGEGPADTPVIPEYREREAQSGPKPAGGLSPERAARAGFGQAEPAVQQLSGACEPMIRNSGIFGYQDESFNYWIYNWTVIDPIVYVNDADNGDPYFSYPYALEMRDGDEPGRDDDWFGQDFYVPSDAASLLVEFNLYYRGDLDTALDPADVGYGEIYRIDDNGSIIDENPGSVDVFDPIAFVQLDAGAVAGKWYRDGFFLNNPTLMAKIRGQRVALVFDQQVNGQLPEESAVIDNPQVTACPTATRPDKAVEGFVEVQGLPLSGQENISITTANLGLLYRASASAAPELVRVTNPFESGYFRFRGLPSLPPGGSYQVIYLNSGYEAEPDFEGGPRLSYYASPLVTSFSGTARDGYFYGDSGVFDIVDIPLAAPAHYAEVSGSVPFSWERRPASGDRGYILCFYDPDTFLEACSTKLITGSGPLISTSVTAAALDAVAGFPFALGKTLGWYVQVAGREDPVNATAYDNIGASRYSQFVTFVAQADISPPPPPAEGGQPPAADPGAESWTLMFYLAGDDADLTSPAGNARGMVDILSNLNQLAEQFPSLNIVVQFDFYERLTGSPPRSDLPVEIRGTQRCYLQADTPALADACQQLGELNTGDPANLKNFIVAALANRPASRTALIVMGHGNGVTGVAGDRTGDAQGADDALRPWELEAALRDAKTATGRKLDLLVFYACLMGNYETAALMAPYASYMVASPNIATLVDINRELLSLAAGSTNPRSVAAGIVGAYNQALRTYNGFYGKNLSIAMSAFDLGRVAALAPLVSALGDAIRTNLNLDDVGNARAAVQLYDSSAPELWGFTGAGEDALVDLRHLATLLAASNNTAVKTAAGNLLSALGTIGGANGMVVARAASSGTADLTAGGSHNLANAAGLSIFFPTGSSVGNQGTLTRNYLLYYRQTSFRSGSWDELVDATRTGIPSLPRGVRLGGLAGVPGSTLQNLGAPEIFPTLSTMPRDIADGIKVHLPLVRKR